MNKYLKYLELIIIISLILNYFFIFLFKKTVPNSEEAILIYRNFEVELSKERTMNRIKNQYLRVYSQAPYQYYTMFLIFNVKTINQMCDIVKNKYSGIYYICNIENNNLNISDKEFILTARILALRPILLSQLSKEKIEENLQRAQAIKETNEAIILYKNFIIERFSEELKKKQYE